MPKGQIIHGYELLDEFTTVGGGQSRWTFAKRNGRTYFLKEFLRPKYPTDDSPGSARIKEEKRQRCEGFEKHHLRLRRELNSACAPGGNLVYTIDFFREGAKYYKVTDKVDISGLRPVDIAMLPIDDRVLVMKTVAHSLTILHKRKIVHGDLKPDNILIKETPNKKFVAKLIDFDNSYFSHEPPDVDGELVGDQVYYSPELSRYFQGDKRVQRKHLYTASDIFSLGVIYCQYITGSIPLFRLDTFRYPCDAVDNGDPLAIPDTTEPLPDSLVNLVLEMLAADQALRPSIEQVFDRLKGWKSSRGKVARSSDTPAEPESASLGELRGSLPTKKKAAEPGDEEVESPQLRGTLTSGKLAPSSDTLAEPESTSLGELRGSLATKKKAAEPGDEEVESPQLRGTLKKK